MRTSTGSNRPAELLRRLEEAPFFQGQIVAVGVTEPREAAFETPERQVNPSLLRKLADNNVHEMYTHQATAFDLAQTGKNIVVTSGTGSGKTLCYNLPVVHRLLQEPAARAIYIFPTKALAQDQLGKLKMLLPEGIKASTYDGDTPKSHRASIRKEAHIILTNPDMLHVGILPNHNGWSKFLKSLRFIVLDEMHAYSGVFGSHVSLVMRRLLRLCTWYGSNPQIIACSATIRNPLELFEDLTSRRADLVHKDGSPSGWRYLVMWNPPAFADGTRRSSLIETSRLLGTLALENARTLAFSQSRIAAELVLSYTRRALSESNECIANKIESYRAGYTPEDRREIERRLFSGELLALSTTNAMELGVDVGLLDVSIMNGYPGSISSLRQQAGRAGRSAKDALAILVARDDPLEQYLVTHPDQVLTGKAEVVQIRPSNPYVLRPQLRCAAYEKPISPSELELFPPNSLEVIEAMEEDGELVRRANSWFYPAFANPASNIDIRGADRQYVIIENGEVIGSAEQWRAFQGAHPKAIYLHRGEQYIVRELDTAGAKIIVEPIEADYYTQSIVETSVWPTVHMQTRPIGAGWITYTALNVTNIVVGFKRRSLLDDTVISIEPLEMPPHSIDTLGVRLDIPKERAADTSATAEQTATWEAGIHATEHLLVSLAPVIAKCEPRDLGSAFYPLWPATGTPAIFVFDSAPGGTGICEALFHAAEEWLQIAREHVESCRCSNGCPACILSPRCPYENEGLDKAQCIKGLRVLT